MGLLKRAFRPDHVWMADDIFGFRVDWLTEFSEHVRELDAGVPFTIQIRANMVSERLAAALKEAGCVEAWIGAESGSQRILDAMTKDTSLEELRSEEHTSELQSLMRISYAVFCLKKQKTDRI